MQPCSMAVSRKVRCPRVLNTIPRIISSDLMKVMLDMGHSDVLILADANYPAQSNAKRLIRLDGVEIPDLLRAILPYFPLDTYVDNPVRLMRNSAADPVPEIWQTYEAIVRELDFAGGFRGFELTDRMPFYEQSRSAFAIVQTATTARYANIVLQKGVI